MEFSFQDPELSYLDLIDKILTNGVKKDNRTGVKTLSLFANCSWESRDLLQNNRFPLFTHRKVYFRSALVELFWILGIIQKQSPIKDSNGNELDRNNIAYLKANNCNYWDKWANENGDLGPVYGAQLENWNDEGINQIDNLINTLKTNPDDRRMVCTMWNPSKLKNMALPPCHYAFECYSKPLENGTRELNIKWTQRSVDVLLGLPYDICLYSWLTIMLAKLTNHVPGTVYGSFGDTHIYENQIDIAEKILKDVSKVGNVPEPPYYALNPNKQYNLLTDFTLDDMIINNYTYRNIYKINVNV